MADKKIPATIVGVPWKFSDVWNLTLDSQKDRPFIARDYIYASEMGGAFCDRYLKMYGVSQTNPPNTRSKRKFQAGNVWEMVLALIMVTSGMMRKKQIRVEHKLPRCLRVSGRTDFIMGGAIDWKYALETVKRWEDTFKDLEVDAPPFFFEAIHKFVEKYSKFSLLRIYIVEFKTCSSFIIERIQKTGLPQPQHVLQEYHYVHGNTEGISEGKIIYLCKDDCIMEEFDLKEDDRFFEAYETDIKTMTKYYNRGFNAKKPLELMPPKEPEVFFDDATFKFSKNWKVEYSGYLTMLYGYKTPEDYRMKWQRSCSAWNSVFKRMAKGKNMTESNVKYIAEVKKTMPGWDKLWDKMVAKAKAAGAYKDETEED